MFNRNNINNRYKISKKVYIVEGDYTNYDFTDYDSTKGGKYKVDYKVTGKNKFNINNEFTTPSTTGKEYITVNGNTTTITPASKIYIRKYFKIKVSPNTTYNINGIISHGMIVIYKHSINTDTFIWDTSYIHTFKNYTKQENMTLAKAILPYSIFLANCSKICLKKSESNVYSSKANNISVL